MLNKIIFFAVRFCTFGFGGGGGGGGGGTDTRYSNLDRLYGVQSQASQFMLDNAMPHIPNLTNNSATMVDDAMTGKLAERARNTAGADANQAFSANMDAVNRNMAKYGGEFNPNALKQQQSTNAILGAANRSNAMNKASQWAEDQKWNRNANFYGQVMGMNNGAMQGMSSAGAGMSNTANAMSANDAANAKGYGQAGSAFASSFMKADGGYIEAPKMAKGGNAWEAYKAANPVSVGGSGRGRSNPYLAMLGGAFPSLAGAGVKDLFKGGDGKIISAIKNWKQSNDLSGMKDTSGTTGSVSPDNMAVDNFNQADLYANNDSINLASGVLNNADAAVTGAEAASTAADAATALDGASQTMSVAPELISSTDMLYFSNGGCVQKHGQKLALGGLANSSMINSDKVDNSSSVAGNDVSGAMSVSKMNNAPTKPVLAVKIAGENGRTDGMGETSSNDPDGFGAKSGDNRHQAGKTTMSVMGNVMAPGYGGLVGSALSELIHPIMENASRKVVMFGDNAGRKTIGKVIGDEDVGGFMGALLDPAAAITSGKYFANGGESDINREDFRPGGEVNGPGNGTSDDIPAWLSSGEHVQNEVSTSIVGKDTLDSINEAGLKVRQGKSSEEAAQQEIGKEMIKRGSELAGGKKNMFACGGMAKKGVHLAGGGFLGGNLGIAMGAGVDQWNRQQQIDQQQQAIDMQKEAAKLNQEQFGWHRDDRKKQELLDTTIKTLAQKEADIRNPESHMAESEKEARAAAERLGIEYTPRTDEQNSVVRAGYTPDQKALDSVNQEYVNAFRSNGKFGDAAAYEDKLKLRGVGDAIKTTLADKNPVLSALAEADPKSAAALYTQGEALDKKLKSSEDRVRDINAAHLREIAAKIALGGKGTGTSSGSSGSVQPTGWDSKLVKTAVDQYFPDANPFQIQTGMDGNKPIIKEIPANDAKTAYMSNLEMLRGTGLSETRAIPEAMKMTKLQLSGQPIPANSPYVPKVVLDGTKARLVMTHDDGSVSILKQNMTDSELEKSNPAILETRKKAVADDWMVKFGQAEQNPEAKTQLMNMLSLKTEEDYQAALQKAKDTWRKFDPVSINTDADVEKAQSSSRSASAGKPSPNQDTANKSSDTWGLFDAAEKMSIEQRIKNKMATKNDLIKLEQLKQKESTLPRSKWWGVPIRDVDQ